MHDNDGSAPGNGRRLAYLDHHVGGGTRRPRLPRPARPVQEPAALAQEPAPAAAPPAAVPAPRESEDGGFALDDLADLGLSEESVDKLLAKIRERS